MPKYWLSPLSISAPSTKGINNFHSMALLMYQTTLCFGLRNGLNSKTSTPYLSLGHGINLKPTSTPSCSGVASASRVSSPAQSVSSITKLDEKEQTPVPVRRRSGSYQPPHWDFHYVQSLKNDYSVISLDLFILIIYSLELTFH